MTMLSPLARGKGSWEGDLETVQSKPVLKPVLKRYLDEDRFLLDKSVINPIRVKSRDGSGGHINSIEREALSSCLVTGSKDAAPHPSFGRYLRHSRGPCTEVSRPRTSKSQHRFTGDPTHPARQPAMHRRMKSVPPMKAERNGQLNLPKTFVTRKGALMLFVSPENLEFSRQDDEECYFYDPNDIDTYQLALQQMTNVHQLTASVLQYDSQQEIYGKPANVARQGENNLTYLREETVDLRTQPGGDFVFYLKDVQAKASYRNLTRSPSYHSLASEEATEDLTSALKAFEGGDCTDPSNMLRNSTLLQDFSTALKRVDRVDSAGSASRSFRSIGGSMVSAGGDAPSNTGSRSIQSVASTAPLSFKEIAASIKCAPYLGRPPSAAYTPTQSIYVPSPPPQVEGHAHPSEEDEESDHHSQDSWRQRPSRYSMRSRRSVASRGAISINSDKSSLGHVSVISERHASPAHDQEEPMVDEQRALSASRTSRTASMQSVDQLEDEGGDNMSGVSKRTEASKRSEASEKLPVNASSLQSEILSLDEQLPETEDNLNEDDWRSEVIEIAVSEIGRPTMGTPAEDLAIDEMEEEGERDLPTTGVRSGMQQNEEWEEKRSPSWVSSASSRRIYIPRTGSSGRTTPVQVDEGGGLAAERTPSAARSERSVLHPIPSESGSIPEVEDGAWPTDQITEQEPDVILAEDERLETENEDEDGMDDVSIEERRQEPVEEEITDPHGPATPLQPEMTAVAVSPKPTTMLPENRVITNKDDTSKSKPGHSATKKIEVTMPGNGEAGSTQRSSKKNSSLAVTMPEAKTAPPEDSAHSTPTGSVTDGTSRRPSTLDANRIHYRPPPEDSTPPMPTGSVVEQTETAGTAVTASQTRVKPKNVVKKSPRSGRKQAGGAEKSGRFGGPQFGYVASIAIDPYATRPSKEEVEELVSEELARELAALNLVEDTKETEKEREEEVDSLATDDEAIEVELKRTRQASSKTKKENKKKLAKERTALKEARRLEKQRREDDRRALMEKRRLMEEERKWQEREERRQKEEVADRIEEAERDAEMARQTEEDAKVMMQEARRVAREEREAKRREDAEKRKMERDKLREERKEMEESAKQREREMADNLASAEERRRLQEEARLGRAEQERLEQEERDRLEDEELMRLEEEEDKIREVERQAERQALERLVREREAAEENRREAELLRRQQMEKEERQRQEELKEKAKEDERLLLLKIEEEQRREKEMERIRQIMRLEEEARLKVRKNLERRRARALRRREMNLEHRGHMNGLRRTQGMTKPWVFTYYVHWPRDSYERRLPSSDKKKRRGRPRAKTAPPSPTAEQNPK